MNIKQLEVFVAIVSTGSFSKGAEQACITQSTASQHIASLEEQCGVRLLDRSGRGTLPTEAGKLLLEYAIQVLKALKKTEQAIIQFRQADGFELRVGGSTIPGTYLLPQAIAALRDNLRGVAVTVDIADSSEIVEKLVREEIEIGVVGKEVTNKMLSATTFGHDEIILVVPKGHRWCESRAATIEDLCGEPLIIRESGSGTHDAVDSVLKGKGITSNDLKIAATFSSSEAVKQGVLAGCGVAFISEMAVRHELLSGELTAIKLPGINIIRCFTLVRRKGRDLSPAAAAFVKILEQL